MTVKIRVIGTPSSVIRGETVVAVTTGVAVGQGNNEQTETVRVWYSILWTLQPASQTPTLYLHASAECTKSTTYINS